MSNSYLLSRDSGFRPERPAVGQSKTSMRENFLPRLLFCLHLVSRCNSILSSRAMNWELLRTHIEIRLFLALALFQIQHCRFVRNSRRSCRCICWSETWDLSVGTGNGSGSILTNFSIGQTALPNSTFSEITSVLSERRNQFADEWRSDVKY